MAFMQWTHDMSVGVPELDDDHRVLISVINELAENRGQEDKVSVLRGCFSHLRSYAEFHFAREEAVMRTVGYGALEEHQVEHRAFEAKMRELGTRLDSDPDEAIGEINAKLLAYLRGWLQHHILVIDMGYRPLVEGKPEASEAASRFKGSHHWWGS